MISRTRLSVLPVITLLALGAGTNMSAQAATDEVKVPVTAVPAEATPAAPSDTVTIPSTDSGQTHFRVLPPKIKPVQTGEEISGAAPTIKLTPHTTLDKLTLTGEQTFDTSFWGDTNLETITAFLQTPTPIIRSPSVRGLLTKATLTPTSQTDEDHDVYSLRIAKLVEIGNFASALALYKLNEQPPPSPLAARAGIESMMGTGELGVACLEQKALPAALKTDMPDLWVSLDTFCKTLLGPVGEQAAETDENVRLQNAARIFLTAVNAKVPTDVAALNALPLPQLNAFARSGQLNSILKNPADLSVLNDKTLKVLVTVPNNNRAVAGVLLTEALQRGLMGPNDLDKLFAPMLADTTSVNAVANDGSKRPGNFDEWRQFLNLYNAKEFMASPIIMAETSKVGGPLAIQAKTEDFLTVNAGDGYTNPTFVRQVLTLFAKTNQGITPEALKKAYPQSFPAANQVSATDEAVTGEKLLTDIFAARYKGNPRRVPQIMALQAIQDGIEVKENDIKSAYDNIFNLTPPDNYVMPNGENLSNLQKSADKKLAGQVVIDSLRMLSGESLQRIHPAALYKILIALDSAGLNEETVALARDVLGDIIEESTKEK